MFFHEFTHYICTSKPIHDTPEWLFKNNKKLQDLVETIKKLPVISNYGAKNWEENLCEILAAWTYFQNRIADCTKIEINKIMEEIAS